MKRKGNDKRQLMKGFAKQWFWSQIKIWNCLIHKKSGGAKLELKREKCYFEVTKLEIRNGSRHLKE